MRSQQTERDLGMTVAFLTCSFYLILWISPSRYLNASMLHVTLPSEVSQHTMSFRVLSAFAAFLLPAALWAQAPTDAFQIRYASNLNIGDSVVNIVNAGSIDGAEPAGNICVNVYVYNPDEQPVSCCTCPTTPNGLKSLSVNGDLNNNPIFPEKFNSLVIKLYATVPVGGACNAAAPGAAAPGIRAWGTTLHALPGGAYGVTETGFSTATLSAGELGKLTSVCKFIQTYGTGFGICNSCRTGGLSAPALNTGL